MRSNSCVICTFINQSPGARVSLCARPADPGDYGGLAVWRLTANQLDLLIYLLTEICYFGLSFDTRDTAPLAMQLVAKWLSPDTLKGNKHGYTHIWQYWRRV